MALTVVCVTFTADGARLKNPIKFGAEPRSEGGHPSRAGDGAQNPGPGPASDYVAFLPGYGAPPRPQYSGYVDASAAEPGTKLHYWFARSSAADWATRPVVLWLNGEAVVTHNSIAD